MHPESREQLVSQRLGRCLNAILYLCWAASLYLKLFGDEEKLKVCIEPELPTPVPSPTLLICASDLPEDLCLASGGKRATPATQAPYCACPK
jgi:hypothetical protein